jgi:hypothetical protein
MIVRFLSALPCSSAPTLTSSLPLFCFTTVASIRRIAVCRKRSVPLHLCFRVPPLWRRPLQASRSGRRILSPRRPQYPHDPYPRGEWGSSIPSQAVETDPFPPPHSSSSSTVLASAPVPSGPLRASSCSSSPHFHTPSVLIENS